MPGLIRSKLTVLLAGAVCLVAVVAALYMVGWSGPVLLKFQPGPAAPSNLSWKYVTGGGLLVLDPAGTIVSHIQTNAYVLAPSDDGSTAILSDGTVMSWNGSVVGSFVPSDTGWVGAKWADDGVHLCATLNASGKAVATVDHMSSSTSTEDAYLWVMEPNQPAKRVARLAGLGEFPIAIYGCSWHTQTAVLSGTHFTTPTGATSNLATVVDLSSGNTRVLPPVAKPIVSLTTPIVAADSSMVVVAELDNSSTSPSWTTEVFRISDEVALVKVPNSLPVGFSPDDTMVVTEPYVTPKSLSGYPVFPPRPDLKAPPSSFTVLSLAAGAEIDHGSQVDQMIGNLLAQDRLGQCGGPSSNPTC